MLPSVMDIARFTVLGVGAIDGELQSSGKKRLALVRSDTFDRLLVIAAWFWKARWSIFLRSQVVLESQVESQMYTR